MQALVDEIAPILRAGDLRVLLQRLNGSGSEVVESEYELAILVGLRRAGSLIHAPESFGPTKPDAYFSSDGGELLADITCVSQASLTSRGPRRFLEDEFLRRVAEQGMPARCFHLQIGHTYDDSKHPRQMRLSVPGARQVKELLNKHIPVLVREFQGATGRVRYQILEPGLDMVVTYDPKGTAFGGGHLVDDIPRLPDQNPVFDALDRKARQLEVCNFSGIKGIFLCDSGSFVLRDGYLAGAVRLADIVKAIFAKHPWLGFVITLYAPQGGGHLRGTLWDPPAARSALSEGLRSMLMSLPSELPEAERDGFNALNWIKAHPDVGASFRGGIKEMTSKRVTISARTLQELLAGRIRLEDWLTSYGFIGDTASPNGNPFERALASGRLISHVHLDRVLTEDDDWLTFHFGDHDAAISPIKRPAKE